MTEDITPIIIAAMDMNGYYDMQGGINPYSTSHALIHPPVTLAVSVGS